MGAGFNLFFHPRVQNAGAGGRWEGQNEGKREEMHAAMSQITPEDWQHLGKGALDGPDGMDKWLCDIQGHTPWYQMLGYKSHLCHLSDMLP